MSETWNIKFDDGSGSCPMMVGYPREHNSPLRHARLSGTWCADVDGNGVITITNMDVKVSDLMLPLPGPAGTEINWMQLQSPVFSLHNSGAVHPHDSSLPSLNTGRIDLTHRFVTLSWGIKVTSPTLEAVEVDPVEIVFAETGYVHPDHDHVLLGGTGKVVAPALHSKLHVMTGNAGINV